MLKLKQLPLAFALLFSTAPSSQAADRAGTTLQDFFTSAINYSPSLKAAEERWHASSARISYANGQLLPQINAEAGVSKNSYQPENRAVTDYTGRNYSVQLSQVLFNWQAFANRQQAYLQGSQAEAEYYAQLAQTLTVIADNYLTALLAEDTLSSIGTELEAINNQVNQIQQMYNLQLAKITDLYRAQAQLSAVQTERITAESDVNISKASLQAASGLEAGGLRRLPAQIEFTPLQGSLEEWLDRAKANNKQIEASTYALQAADKAVSQRIGGYLPRVNLVVGRQTSDIGYQNAPIARTDSNYASINFSMPLFAGGSNRALVREAESQRNVAEDQMKQTRLDVFDRARNAYYKAKAGESRIKASKQQAEAMTLSYNAMKRGLELGAVTTVDMLNALRDQFRAQRDLQQAQYDYLRYKLVLKRESGTLTAQDMQEVSDLLNAPPAR